MSDFPNIKTRGKEFNQDSLDPNVPKKNPPNGMGARKDKQSIVDGPDKS